MEESNALKVFDFEGTSVRVIEKDNDLWWVLRDVCDVLGLTTPAKVAERLEDDEVNQTHIIDSLGRQRQTTIISESGLYNVIIRSEKPDAKKFKRWITHDVLPSIRKHGTYMTPQKKDYRELFGIGLFDRMDDLDRRDER